MASDFSFANYDSNKLKEHIDVEEETKELKPLDEKPEDKQSKHKKQINFQQMPAGTDQILGLDEKKKDDLVDKYLQEEIIPMPTEQSNTNTYLSLVLSPNLRELELMIRGLEYVKRINPITRKEEIILRKIKDHPLNEYGINRIMSELKIYSCPEIKLGRKSERDYYNSVKHVCHSVVRLIYKNLKNFGMDTQTKQRNAKPLCNAIIEFVDAAYSRSIEGKENDLSRATEFKIEGNIDTLNDPAKLFSKPQKEQLKN